MSISTFMGMPMSDLKTLDPEVGFKVYALKAGQNNHEIKKPRKYQVAIPASVGVLLGVSIAYFSKTGGSR